MLICKKAYNACKRIVRALNLSCLNKVCSFGIMTSFLALVIWNVFEIQTVRKRNCITFSKTKVFVEQECWLFPCRSWQIICFSKSRRWTLEKSKHACCILFFKITSCGFFAKPWIFCKKKNVFQFWAWLCGLCLLWEKCCSQILSEEQFVLFFKQKFTNKFWICAFPFHGAQLGMSHHLLK